MKSYAVRYREGGEADDDERAMGRFRDAESDKRGAIVAGEEKAGRALSSTASVITRHRFGDRRPEPPRRRG